MSAWDGALPGLLTATYSITVLLLIAVRLLKSLPVKVIAMTTELGLIALLVPTPGPLGKPLFKG